MVLRSGAKLGPAGGWDRAGAAAGVAVVLVLILFVVVAGTRDGYSHIDDTISQLGARGTPGAWWFTVVNVAGALLIIVFAYGVHRRLPVGLATGAFLGAVAFGALMIGGFRCSGECRPGVEDAHGVAASFTAAMITGFLVAAAWALRRSAVHWFRNITLACTIANIAFGVALLTRGTNSGGVGLLERLFWASAYAWVLVASWAIIEATRRRTSRPPEFDPALVQRKLLRSASKAIHSAYEFFSITDSAGAKRWLTAAIDPTRGVVLADDGTGSSGSVTIVFTCAGLRRLGVDYRGNDAFAEGMKARAARLGDVGQSDPSHWQDIWRGRDLHLLIWVEAEDEATLDALVEKVRGLHREALRSIGTEYAISIHNDDSKLVDHRGFRDGISQPWVLLKDGKPKDSTPERIDGKQKDDQRPGGGTLDPFGDWRPLAIGEFVLGQRDESDDVPPVPEPTAIFKHGSFVVVRKLAQDVDGIAAFMKTESIRLGVDDLEERLLGRRRDGRLLNASAGGPEPNKFTFGLDAEGLVCPLGAHIRRANPRDALGFGMHLSERHRIIRRGNTYSADEGAPAPWKKGLMFIAVNARIEDQFEFIQRLWLNDGDRQRLGASRDVIAGSSRSVSNAVVQVNDEPKVTTEIPVFVRTMGGEYFFAPSMAGLRALAESESATR